MKTTMLWAATFISGTMAMAQMGPGDVGSVDATHVRCETFNNTSGEVAAKKFELRSNSLPQEFLITELENTKVFVRISYSTDVTFPSNEFEVVSKIGGSATFSPMTSGAAPLSQLQISENNKLISVVCRYSK